MSAQFNAKETMSSGEFFRLATDFEFIPHASKKDIYKIFRTCLSTNSSEIPFDKFEICLLSYAQTAFSKHPYDNKYPTLSEKLLAVFDRLEIKDWSLIKKRLERLGRVTTTRLDSVPVPNIPGRSDHSMIMKSPRKLQPIGKFLSFDLLIYFLDELPSEEELDLILQNIFLHHATSLPQKSPTLKSHQFIKLMKESQVIDLNFSKVEADIIFVEVTNNGQHQMTYDLFCESLSVVSQRKYYSSLSSVDSLRKLLLEHVIPYGNSLERR